MARSPKGGRTAEHARGNAARQVHHRKQPRVGVNSPHWAFGSVELESRLSPSDAPDRHSALTSVGHTQHRLLTPAPSPRVGGALGRAVLAPSVPEDNRRIGLRYRHRRAAAFQRHRARAGQAAQEDRASPPPPAVSVARAAARDLAAARKACSSIRRRDVVVTAGGRSLDSDRRFRRLRCRCGREDR
jgi:hypothetical protein